MIETPNYIGRVNFRRRFESLVAIQSYICIAYACRAALFRVCKDLHTDAKDVARKERQTGGGGVGAEGVNWEVEEDGRSRRSQFRNLISRSHSNDAHIPYGHTPTLRDGAAGM